MFTWTISRRYFEYIHARVLESSDLAIRMKLQLERSDWNTNTFTLYYQLGSEDVVTLLNMLQYQNDTLVMRNLFFSLFQRDSNRIPRVVRLGSSSVYAVDAEMIDYRDVAVAFLFASECLDPADERGVRSLPRADLALLLRGEKRD